MTCFRVTAKPLGGEEFIIELFDSKGDAEKFYEELQKGEDNMLEAVSANAVVIELGEFVNGVWTTASRRLVDLRDSPRIG